MPLGHAAHDGKAQADASGAAVAAGIQARERFEEALALPGRHARAVVIDVDDGLAANALDRERHARMGIAHGVAHDVHERAREVLRVAGEALRDVLRRIDGHVAPRGAHLVVGAAHHFVQQHARGDVLGRVGRGFAQVGEHEEFAHEVLEVFHVAADVGEAVFALLLVGCGAREFRVELELRKRRPQFVRHPLLQVAVRIHERMHAPGHRVEGARNRKQERIPADLRAHLEVALAHARRSGLQVFELAPEGLHPAPEDRAHGERHERHDDRVVDRQVFVGAHPLDAQHAVGIAHLSQVDLAATGAVAERDLAGAQPLLLGAGHEPVVGRALERHDLVLDTEGLLDLLQAALPIGNFLRADDALCPVEGDPGARALLLRVHLRHHLVGDVHEQHESHRRRQHEEKVQAQEEPEHRPMRPGA